MHIGFFTVHPLTVPFSNELVHAIACIVSQGYLVFNGTIQPEIQELNKVLSIL